MNEEKRDPSENDGKIMRKKKEMESKVSTRFCPKILIKKPRTRKLEPAALPEGKAQV